MSKQGDILGSVKSLSAYHSVYELLNTEGFLPDDIEPNYDSFLRCCDDFESFAYFCANNEIIITTDSVNGDVLSACSVDDFLRDLREEYELEYVGA